MFLKIAVRNVLRNKRRTLLSAGVVALGVMILMLVLGFISGSILSTKIQLARETGALQVAAGVLFDNRATGFEYLIDPDTLARVVGWLDADKRVAGHAVQLGFGGIVGNEKGSALLIARGLVPGNPIEDYAHQVLAGQPLDDGGEPQIILGAELAKTLGVAPGDWVNLATGTVSGAFKAASARVRGAFRYNNQAQERQLGLVPLAFAQKLLRTDGVERVLVQLHDLDQAAAVAGDLEAALRAQGIALEARTWEELAPFYESIRQFWGVFSAFTTVGVFVLAFFSVLEVLTMAFLERAREVGTVRALGTRRFQVFATFLLEGPMLGALGGGSGLALGAAAAVGINAAQIGWMPPGTIEPVPFYLVLSAPALAIPLAVALISTALGALYPAAANARRNIVQALGYV